MEFGLLAVVVAAGLAALAQIRSDPRITKEFRRRSYAALGFYAVFVACGIVALFLFPFRPGSAVVALSGTVFILAWIAIGALWLMRLAPRLKEPPGWLMKPWSPLDWSLIVIAIGAATLGSLL
jgi:hypothetical protein